MNSSGHTPLKVEFPLMVVAQDEKDRMGLLCQLFHHHTFESIHGNKLVAYVGRSNLNKELVEILERDKWEYLDTVGFCQDIIEEIYSTMEWNKCFLILDVDEVRAIGRHHKLANLLIGDCITKYNITPVLLSDRLVSRRIELQCGYVYFFPNHPVNCQFDAKPRHLISPCELVDAFSELVCMNRNDECSETDNSFLFVDTTPDHLKKT